MSISPLQDPEEFEMQITIRNKATGTAQEHVFYKVQDIHPYSAEVERIIDMVLSFKALRDPEHNDRSYMVKDLGIVPPCVCYKKLTE